MARLPRIELPNIPQHYMEDELLSDIRLALNKGMALGNERFKSEIETLSGRRVTDGKRGRPVGWRKNKVSDKV